MNTSKITKDAKTIANIITKTDKEHLGNLFMEVAHHLNKRNCNRNFTSESFDKMAVGHGIYRPESLESGFLDE